VSRADVATRLTESLDGVADRYDPVPPPFAPSRSPSVVLPGEAAAGGSRRPGRVWLVAAAAAVALVAGVASVVALRDDDPGDDPGDVQAGDTPSLPVPAPAPDGMLLPTELPEGMDLWALQWRPPTPTDGGPVLLQAFEDGARERRVVITEAPDAFFAAAGNSATPVRGHPATVTAPNAASGELKTVSWGEDGNIVEANIVGMTAAEGIAFLEQLERRSGDGVRGFDAPSGVPLQLAAEAVDDSTTLRPIVWAAYGRGLPRDGGSDGRLSVWVMPATGAPRPEHVRARLWATVDDDGTVVSGEGGHRTWYRPDGLIVAVSAGAEVDPADLERLVGSLAPVTAADLVARRDQAEAWAQSELPVAASAALPSGVVEVRGAAGFHVLCARLPADGPGRCSVGSLPPPMDTGEVATVFAGDDRWYAVVATTRAPTMNWHGNGGSSPPPADAVPEEATDGAWLISLLPVPSTEPAVTVGGGREGTDVLIRDHAR
jgi:hypothetical protein